jgi:hemerythrin-like metal-binding protein
MDVLEIFPWNDNFATGLADVDDQHRRLIELLNQLVRRMAFRDEKPAVSEVLRALEDYAAEHFQSEEKIWRAHFEGDPWLDRHEVEHVDFVRKLAEVKGSGGSDEAIVERLVSFLTHWLAQHIIEADKRMAIVVQVLPTVSTLAEAKAIASDRMAGATRTLIDTMMSMYDHLALRTAHLTREIHARAQAEAALRAAQRDLERKHAELERLEAMRDGLVHMVVHDMRTPIGAISLALDAVRGDVAGIARRDALEFLDDARAYTARLARMASDLLDVSRLEARQLTIAPRACALRPLAESAVATVGRLYPDVKVAVRGEPELRASCDVDLVRRVLENLIGNALRHSPPQGTVHVTIERRADGVHVTVRDEGRGVAADEVPRLFEKFRAGIDRRGTRGVGLGLVFCKLAVEAHEGTIAVDSPAGSGATFSFTLPASID